MRKRTLGAMALLSIMGATATSRADGWAVHAKGQVAYRDAVFAPGSRPAYALNHVRVRLMDSDTVWDEEMAQGTTDAAGRFDLQGRGDDWCCGSSEKPDPYIQVVLQVDSWIDVENIAGFSYRFHTPVHSNTSGAIEFGTVLVEDDEKASLYARGTQQYSYFRDKTGGQSVPGYDGHVEIDVPAIIEFGTPWTTPEAIHWPGGLDTVDTVYHEFGHRIREAADGGKLHFYKDVIEYDYARHHKNDLLSCPGFAFNEGWAEYHSTLRGISATPHQDFLDTFTSWKTRDGGDAVEGNVAHKLLLVSNACGGFETMWSVLKDAGEAAIHSYGEFHTAFGKKHSACLKKVAGAEPVAPPASAATCGIFDPGPPPPDAVPLAVQIAEMKRVVDQIDARAASQTYTQKSSVSALATQAPALAPTLARVHAKRVAHAQRLDASARTNLRASLLSVKPMTKQNVADGTWETQVTTARSAYVTGVATPLLADVQAFSRDLVAERAAARDPRLVKYLDKLTAKYGRMEKEIQAALASRGTAKKIPDVLIPKSFHGALAVTTIPVTVP